KQIADIDLSEYSQDNGWQPIGGENEIFTGVYNGNDHEIINLTIDRKERFIGLFGNISSSAILKKVILKDVDIIGKNWVGGLAGENEGKIIDSSVIGDYGEVVARDTVGGLVGLNKGKIKKCSASVKVMAKSTGAGGLAGDNVNGEGVIEDSYAEGEVMGKAIVGGLVGFNRGEIKNSEATGNVVGDHHVGGLVGLGGREGKVTNSDGKGRVTGK
ncbi:MAG: GLUG motif-containing protein, partial [Halanaerobiales bacterium]